MAVSESLLGRDFVWARGGRSFEFLLGRDRLLRTAVSRGACEEKRRVRWGGREIRTWLFHWDGDECRW